MKFVKTIFVTAMTALVGMGVFTGAMNKSQKVEEPVAVEAATVSANKRIYLNTTSFTGWESGAMFKMWFKTGGTNSCNAAGTRITVKGASSDHIYVFTNTKSYDSVYVERRKSDDSEGWNGFDITGSTTQNVVKVNDWNAGSYDAGTYNIYYEEVTATSGGSATMYVKGQSGQSGNGYYYTHNGLTLTATANSGYHFVRWERNGTSVSTNSTYTINTIGGDYTWRAVFEQNVYYTVRFYLDDKTTLYDSVQVLKGNTAACSKANPTKSSEGHVHYTFNKWVNDDGTDAVLTDITGNLDVYASFSTSYDTGRYIVGTYGSCSWGVEGAVRMDTVKNQYEATVTFERGDEFKIAYCNGTSLESYFGYDFIVTSCGGLFCFERSSEGYDPNIRCVAGGTYNLYFTDSDWDGKKISIEISGGNINTAEQLATKLMTFSDTSGTCGNNDRFPAMKAIFLNNLNGTEKSNFQGFVSSEITLFNNGYRRYVAWANALKQKPWEEGAASGAVIPSVFGDNGSSAIPVVITAVVALGAVGGFFLIKKKKISK